MIRFTGYGVIAQKPRVSYHEIFPCTLYEKLCVGSKMIATSYNALDVLYNVGAPQFAASEIAADEIAAKNRPLCKGPPT